MTSTSVGRALGLDIGGSSVKWALVEIGTSPRVVATGLRPIADSRAPSDVIGRLEEITGMVRTTHGSLTSIGVGVPGMFDQLTRTPTLLPNFPTEWHGLALGDLVEVRLGQQITLVNDAKAFSIAESVLGAGAGHHLVTCVVLGTGVGGGIVKDGVLIVGRGSAGELGHITVELDGPLCGCGNFGCVEAFVGSSAISAFADQPTAEAVFAAALEHDGQAQASIDRAVRALGAGLANVFITLAPDIIVVGGGIAGAGSQLIEPLEREIRRRVKVAPASDIAVRQASLGRFAGAIGAALMSYSSATS